MKYLVANALAVTILWLVAVVGIAAWAAVTVKLAVWIWRMIV